VAGLAADELRDLSDCRTRLTRSEAVATAGSCFAQHISRRLRSMGYNFLDTEMPPPWMTAEAQRDFGYGLFSARYGNIYTSRQLKQLLLESRGKFEPEERVWETDSRFFDPFRPTIEPHGFESTEEVLLSRETLLQAIRRIVAKADVFVFTFGLTECWRSKRDGAVYPMCPGTHAGQFDPDRYEFINLSFADVLDDMHQVIEILRRVRPSLRFIFTVSPVPLTATASGSHVLTATTYSKSVLRAVAGELRNTYDFVDYFPSYELVTSPALGGTFYSANKRDVTPDGVSTVMKIFEAEFCDGKSEPVPTRPKPVEDEADRDVLCDERVLEFYANE
jgi:hypothetical protein